MSTLKELKGLGGWLIVVGLGLVLSLLYQAYLTTVSIVPFTNGAMRVLSDPQSAGYIPGYAELLGFAVVAHILFLIALVWLLILFSKEKQAFPRHYVTVLVMFAIYSVVHHGLLSHAVARSSQLIQENMSDALSTGGADVARSILAMIVWGLYMLKSKRVKATFVR